MFGFVSNSIFDSVIMSNRNHNVYENLNLFEEIWERKMNVKRRRIRKKKRSKSNILIIMYYYCRNAQKKSDDNDLKTAAFRPPVQQKKKNKRPIKGQKRGKFLFYDCYL